MTMKYSPKLKRAAEEIKKILKDYDIAGFVAIHTPGHGEYVLALSPTYSYAKVDINKGTIRLQSRLKEDYRGDSELKRQMDQDTANMLHILGQLTGKMSLSLITMSEKADEILGADHDGPGMSHNPEQNN